MLAAISLLDVEQVAHSVQLVKEVVLLSDHGILDRNSGIGRGCS